MAKAVSDEEIRNAVQKYMGSQDPQEMMSLTMKDVMTNVMSGFSLDAEQAEKAKELIEEEFLDFLGSMQDLDCDSDSAGEDEEVVSSSEQEDEDDDDDEEEEQVKKSTKRKRSNNSSSSSSGSKKKKGSISGEKNTAKNSPHYSKLRRLCLARNLKINKLGLGKLSLGEASRALKEVLTKEGGYSAEELSSEAIDEVLEKAELEKEVSSLGVVKEGEEEEEEEETSGRRRKTTSYAQYFEGNQEDSEISEEEEDDDESVSDVEEEDEYESSDEELSS